MFQNNSIDIGVPNYLLDDLKHQLELNPEMKASEILEELQAGRCLKNSYSEIPRLDNFDLIIKGSDWEDEDCLTITLEPNEEYIRSLNWEYKDFNIQKFLKNNNFYKVVDVDECLPEAILKLQKKFETRLNKSFEADKCKKALEKTKADFWRNMGVSA